MKVNVTKAVPATRTYPYIAQRSDGYFKGTYYLICIGGFVRLNHTSEHTKEFDGWSYIGSFHTWDAFASESMFEPVNEPVVIENDFIENE